uniref:Uncharacterized protein n=1 Tax=Anguilla anguilla TaxID=7936 RepID=A0A0E9TZ90_ANGAN
MFQNLHERRSLWVLKSML